MDPRPWEQSWQTANSFYLTQLPRDHFRTNVMTEVALPTVIDTVESLLGVLDEIQVIDVGSGAGELLVGLLDHFADLVDARILTLTGIDLRPRPAELPERIEWLTGSFRDVTPDDINGLLIAHELLDDIPCPAIEIDEDCVPRLVLVDSTGRESLGDPASDEQCEWLARWWPISGPYERAEVGLPRDEAWAWLVSRVRNGLAIASDYGHTAAERTAGRWPLGTITAYRHGMQVRAVPDGTCNITAHVAMDSLPGANPETLYRDGTMWWLTVAVGSYLDSMGD